MQTESEGLGKKIFHANNNQKEKGVAILISDKTDFNIKIIIRNKEGTLHNDQRINPRRRHNNYIYLSIYLSIFL